MNMNKWVLLLFVLPVFLPACRKNREKPKMKISGKVSDRADNSGIQGATVRIYYKPYQNGVYTNNFSSLTSTTTDAAGNYNFEIEKPNTSDFKFEVEANNYFATQKTVNPDNLSTANPNTLNFETDPSCDIHFHFKNVSPVDINDHLQFKPSGLLAECVTCCTNAVLNYDGTAVDESFTCTRYAKKYFRYQYFVTKSGVTMPYIDSVYCTWGTTVNVEILY